jgi:CRP/FNR family cyclic AMP-dependent transcriptional regulator
MAVIPIPDSEKRRFLSASPLFSAFAPAELERLAARLVERRYRDRQTIFSRGDPGSSMMVVVDGRVRIGVTSAEGRELLLAVMGRGQVFGELALLDQRPRSADATALGDCRLLTLDRRDFLPVLRQSPEAALRLFEVVCGRIRAANDQIEEALLMTVEARLARLLLNLASACRRGSACTAVVDGTLSQGDLGRLIGASRQEVNRHLRQWLAQGQLAQQGRALVIRKPGELRRIAGVAADADFLRAVGQPTSVAHVAA